MKNEIRTKNAPAAVGAYSQGIEHNGRIFTSGQLPLSPNGDMICDDVKEQTKQSLENLKGILNEVGKNLEDVIKTTVLLTDIEDFEAVNEVYEKYFSKPYPARSCFAVKALPKGAKVEIEVIV